MYNSQSTRIGSCKWHNCSCQSGEIGENRNGIFYCANCDHQINHHFATNNYINSNILYNTSQNTNPINNNMPPYIRSSVQHHNVVNYLPINRSELNISSPLLNNSSSNYNYMDSLQYVRSPMLQQAFDSILSSTHNTSSLNSHNVNYINSSQSNNTSFTSNVINNMNVNVPNTSRNTSPRNIYNVTSVNDNQNLGREININESTDREIGGNSAMSHQSTLEFNSIIELDNITNQNRREQQHHYANGLTLDNLSERQIDLNHIPQSLDNQFEREFTYNHPENTTRHDPIEEKSIKIDLYLYKDNKFNKRYNDQNTDDITYLNDSNFKIPVEFNNTGHTLLPFIKIRNEIQKVINEDISTNDRLYPIHYLTGHGVKLNDARNVNYLVNFNRISAMFRNKRKKKRLDVFVNNPDVILTPKSSNNIAGNNIDDEIEVLENEDIDEITADENSLSDNNFSRDNNNTMNDNMESNVDNISHHTYDNQIMEILSEDDETYNRIESISSTYSSISSSDSSQSEYIESHESSSENSRDNINDESETSTTIDTNGNFEAIDLTLPFYSVDGQQSNITKRGNLWFNNDNYYFVFGSNPMSKFNLFRYNIFRSHNTPVRARQDEQNLVTYYRWPKSTYHMTNDDYNNSDYIFELFMDMILMNKTNICHILQDKAFYIDDNNVIDSGGVSQEAISLFSNIFMRKLYAMYPYYMTNENDLYYSFKNMTSNSTRDSAIESFILGTIFILFFTGRCPCQADPSLCATIFNYSEIIPVEFYDNYHNLYSFLDNHDLQTYIRSLHNDNTFNLEDYYNDADTTLPKILYDFCEQCNINIHLATYHLQNGTFENLCKQKYCEDSVNVGRYIVDNWLEEVFGHLNIRCYEFCQMVNYDTNISTYYWSHYEKVDTLEKFLLCLKTECETDFNREVGKIEQNFGPVHQIHDLSILRNRIMRNRSLEEPDKAKQLFKYYFTLCLLKATGEEIYLLYKYITGENYALGYKGVSINYSEHYTTSPNNFMVAHTCFKSLELKIHVNQIDIILLSFESFREAVNSQFSGNAYNIT